MTNDTLKYSLLSLALTILQSATGAPVDTLITFQGSLFDSGGAANGSYDLNFQLWDAADAGSGGVLGGTLSEDNVSVADGVFTVYLDFGTSAFDNEARWIEVMVRDGASSGAFTPLAPFVPLTPAPQAHWAVDAGLLQGMSPGAFALSAHTHADLNAGSGLTGGTYDGGATSTFDVDFGAGVGQVAPGNANIVLTAGNGLVGGISNDSIGDGVNGSLAVVPGPGITTSSGSVSVRVDSNTVTLDGSSQLRVNSGIIGNGLYNADSGSGISIAVNDGDGINTAGGKVNVSVDTTTIDFNSSGELMAVTGPGGGPAKRAIVALSGGDYSDPVAAMNDRANWCGTPSQSNPCLIKIMPGVYNLAAVLSLQDYIDIEGSGRGMTVLSRTNTGTTSGIVGASGSCTSERCELRDLTLRAGATGTAVVGIYSASGGAPRVRNVAIDLSIPSGTAWAVRANQGDIALTDCTIFVTGSDARGIYAGNADIAVTRSEIEAVGSSLTEAVYAGDATINSRDSQFNASGAAANSRAIFLTDTSMTDSGSEFFGGPGSTEGVGIFAQSSAGGYVLILTGSRVLATHPSASANRAIWAQSYTVELKDTFLQAWSGTGTNKGIEVYQSWVTIDDSTILSNDGAFTVIGSSGGLYQVRISDSKLTATSPAGPVQGSAAFDIRVFHSFLKGGAATFTNCVSVVDENFAYFETTCP